MDVERIIKELRPVAEKLGEGAVEVYELAVRQAIARGIGYAVVTVVMVVAAYACYRIFRWCRHELAEQSNRYDGEGYLFGGVFAILGCVAAGITALVFAYHAVLVLVNPKWAAIQEILGQLR